MEDIIALVFLFLVPILLLHLIYKVFCLLRATTFSDARALKKVFLAISWVSLFVNVVASVAYFSVLAYSLVFMGPGSATGIPLGIAIVVWVVALVPLGFCGYILHVNKAFFES